MSASLHLRSGKSNESPGYFGSRIKAQATLVLYTIRLFNVPLVRIREPDQHFQYPHLVLTSMQSIPCGNESVKITFPTLLHGAHLSDDQIKVIENAIAQMVCLVLSIPLLLSPRCMVQEHWNSLVSSPIVSRICPAVQVEQCLAIDNKVYHYPRSSSYVVLIQSSYQGIQNLQCWHRQLGCP